MWGLQICFAWDFALMTWMAPRTDQLRHVWCEDDRLILHGDFALDFSMTKGNVGRIWRGTFLGLFSPLVSP